MRRLDFRTEIHSEPARTRTFQVYGTVCGLPTVAWWRGTVSRTDEGFVWHLQAPS